MRHDLNPLLMSTMYFCPIYTFMPFGEPGDEYAQVFMTLESEILAEKPSLIYPNHPTEFKKHIHYWSLMTINPLLCILGSQRYLEKIPNARVKEIYTQVRRLLPLFSRCREHCLQHKIIPNDEQVTKMITGSPRAWIFPDRVTSQVTFESIMRGSFFPLKTMTFHVNTPVNLLTWQLLGENWTQAKIKMPVAATTRLLLDVFHEPDKQAIWLDLMNPDGFTGALETWAALFPDSYQKLLSGYPEIEGRIACDDIYLHSDIVDLRKLEAARPRTLWLQDQILRKARAFMGVEITKPEDHTWLMATMLRICILEELAISVEMPSARKNGFTLQEALDFEFGIPPNKIGFASFLDQDEWQPNRKLALEMQAEVETHVYRNDCELLRAMAALRGILPLPDKIAANRNSLSACSFAEQLMGTMGYIGEEMHCQPPISAERQHIMVDIIESPWGQRARFQSSAKQRVMNFCHGMGNGLITPIDLQHLAQHDTPCPTRESVGQLRLRLAEVSFFLCVLFRV